MGFDLDRLERLAGGLAAIFYALLFLAFITAVMGSGGGGLLLLVLGAAAHVGRVGLEDFVERRRAFGDAAGPEEGDAGERAIGLHVRWLPELRLPRRIDLGAVRSRVAAAALRARRSEDTGEEASRSQAAADRIAGSGEAAGAALGRIGSMLATAGADVRTSFAALVAEIRERPAGTPRHPFDLPHQDVENASGPDLYDDGIDEDLGFVAFEDDFAATSSRYEDFEVADGEYEDFEVVDEEHGDFAVAEPEPDLDLQPLAAARPRRETAPTSDAPTAQERYEARQRARAERGQDEPIVAAVEAAETQRPQRVQRRQPGGRPDPLRTRRPTRSF